MFKRFFDVVFGLLALILTLPMMALSALLVYLEGGSPVIFCQQRVGKDGKLFVIFKIRTMVHNAEQLQSQFEQRDLEGNLIAK